MLKDLPASESIIEGMFMSTLMRGVDADASYLTLHTVILAEMIDKLNRMPDAFREEHGVDAEQQKILHPGFELPSQVHNDVLYLSMLAHEVVRRLQIHYADKPHAN